MEKIRIEIECPKCKSKECESDSYYKEGIDDIFCPICEYHVKLIHGRDENGNFIWKGDGNEITNDSIILEQVVSEYPYAAYSVDDDEYNDDDHCIDNYDYYEEGASGRLEMKINYDNFISYIDSLLKQKHHIKRVSISRFENGEDIEKVYFEQVK